MKCQNNMKQIGLALHNYHDAYQKFPVGSPGSRTIGSTPNWRVRIFPYMEMDNEYTTLGAASNASMVSTANKAFLAGRVFPGWKCPSSAQPDCYTQADDTNDATNDYGARNNDGGFFKFSNVGANGQQIPAYVGISGAYNDPAGRDSTRTADSSYYGRIADTGMLLLNEQTTLTKCDDGTSNTIIVAEQSGLNGLYDMRNRHASPWGAAAIDPSSGSDPQIDSNVNWLASNIRPSAPNRWSFYAVGIVTVRALPNTALSVTGGDFPYSANTPLNSFHTGGINALLADGSVRFVANGVPFATLAKLCARDDGQPVGDY
jgi:prepilin-type processing-associated H-X9-DG protein